MGTSGRETDEQAAPPCDTPRAHGHEPIEGFEIGEKPSDGEVLCTGCWDKSDHDIEKNNDIPAGDPIYFRMTSYECDEWDAYCSKCAAARAAFWNDVSLEEGRSAASESTSSHALEGEGRDER